ncbi:DUF397 domain-containing protein [Actinomadura fulvescens]|uniref:DUF397 domain-containing protein n=1 Tax=Actinomadura fulvescens TaxID=46160 RepID=UPI0031D60410
MAKAVWRKSSRSTANGGDCVEIASLPDVIAVRDSKDPSGSKLTFAPDAFRCFVGNIKSS